MRIIFRVDASLQIGTGHIMRCLSLAQVLKEYGASVEFICRAHKGNLIEKVKNKGFNVYKLGKVLKNIYDSKLPHSHLLGTTQHQDASECKTILQQANPDWIVVDHYGIDEDWQKELQNFYNKLMVIDDLADRKHQCDILLDQTFGRKKLDYINLTPKDCKHLLGSKYALLRSEFAKLRKFSAKRRRNSEFKKILITMGGVDTDNNTEQVLDKLEECHLSSDIEVTVVMGETAPNIESVKTKISVLSYKAELRVHVENMAKIMANSDIVIGAAGSTTWERCCLGVPGIQMVVAKNQAKTGSELESIMPIAPFNNMHHLCEQISHIKQIYKKMACIGLLLTNGKGSSTIANILYGNEYTANIDLRPARMEDIGFVYNLQTEEARRFFKNKKIPSKVEHKTWYEKMFKSKDTVLFVICVDESNAGVIRLDNIDTDEAKISIIISSEYSRMGVASTALKIIIDSLPQFKMKASININNISSIKLFEKSGFILINQKEDFYTYELAS